jgi:hypothetical protein
VVQFPGIEDTLLTLEEGKLYDEAKKEFKGAGQCQPSFTHFTTECKGSIKVVQVELSKEQVIPSHTRLLTCNLTHLCCRCRVGCVV